MPISSLVSARSSIIDLAWVMKNSFLLMDIIIYIETIMLDSGNSCHFHNAFSRTDMRNKVMEQPIRTPSASTQSGMGASGGTMVLLA